jgi:hypothetical protein
MYYSATQTRRGIRGLIIADLFCNLMSSRSAVLNALRSISERISFAVFLRMAIAIDPLYEVPSSDSAVGVPIIVECHLQLTGNLFRCSLELFSC